MPEPAHNDYLSEFLQAHIRLDEALQAIQKEMRLSNYHLPGNAAYTAYQEALRIQDEKSLRYWSQVWRCEQQAVHQSPIPRHKEDGGRAIKAPGRVSDKLPDEWRCSTCLKALKPDDMVLVTHTTP